MRERYSSSSSETISERAFDFLNLFKILCKSSYTHEGDTRRITHHKNDKSLQLIKYPITFPSIPSRSKFFLILSAEHVPKVHPNKFIKFYTEDRKYSPMHASHSDFSLVPSNSPRKKGGSGKRTRRTGHRHVLEVAVLFPPPFYPLSPRSSLAVPLCPSHISSGIFVCISR